MSKVLTAKQICEMALGAISEFPVTESAADGEQLRRAMQWLDVLLAEEMGTRRVFNMIPATTTIALEADTAIYELNDALGADLPPDGMQFPVDAWLEDDDGNRYHVKICTLDDFNAVWRDGETGRPTDIHISRLPTPVMRVFPVVSSTDPATWSVKLDLQSYAPNVAPAGVTGTQPQSSIAHGFRAAWQRFLIFKHTVDIGSGPIRKLPEASLKRFEAMAEDARKRLEAFENREHQTSDPICEPWGM